MKKPLPLILLVLLLSLLFPSTSFAQSNYVLPYPAVMPGSKLYVLQEIKNKALQYWHFGNFAQFQYNLKQTDKYLVEAKTLFEYKQYLLADRALKKSDQYFQKLPIFLDNAKKENKDISEKKLILKSASDKHIELLKRLKGDVPESFNWQPEKDEATMLNLKESVEKSIQLRVRTL